MDKKQRTFKSETKEAPSGQKLFDYEHLESKNDTESRPSEPY